MLALHTDPGKDDAVITLHHLSYSRSTRIIWALEELGLPYEIVRHERTETFKAPDALGKVHPLGKAPVIVDGALVIGESAVILSYIDTTHGGGRLTPPPGTPAFWRHEEWLHYAESTAALPIMSMRLGALTGGISPGLKTFLAPVLAKTLDNIAAGVRGGAFLMGEGLTLADIQMSYLLEVAERTALLGDHPQIVAYLGRLKARPAFIKAVEIGGPMMPPPK